MLLLGFAQVEVFYELHSSTIKMYGRGESGEADNDIALPDLFGTSEDRLFMMSMLLHCQFLTNDLQ